MIRAAKLLADSEEVGRKITADFLICAGCSMSTFFAVYQVRIDDEKHFGHFHVRCSMCDRHYCLEAREVPNHEPQENHSLV